MIKAETLIATLPKISCGCPAAISYDQLTSLLETLDILADSEFAEQLGESMAQAVRGETVSWEEAKSKLGL